MSILFASVDNRTVLVYCSPMPNFTIETEQETDGRWIAEVPEIPGVMVYGVTENDARAKAEALARKVIADG